MSDEVQNNAQEVNENVEAVETNNEVQTVEDDYSWVPKKFLRDGKPDIQGLAKSYQSLEKRMGSKSLASEAIEDYAFESKYGFDYDAETTSAFKSEAQKAGLSPEQYAWVMEKYESEVDRIAMTPDKAEKTLRQTWGKSFDTNLNYARQAWEAFGPSDISIDEVGNNPQVLKILARVGAELGEDKPSARGASTGRGVSEEEINEVIRSKDYTTNLKKQEMVRKWYEQQYGE